MTYTHIELTADSETAAGVPSVFLVRGDQIISMTPTIRGTSVVLEGWRFAVDVKEPYGKLTRALRGCACQRKLSG